MASEHGPRLPWLIAKDQPSTLEPNKAMIANNSTRPGRTANGVWFRVPNLPDAAR